MIIIIIIITLNDTMGALSPGNDTLRFGSWRTKMRKNAGVLPLSFSILVVGLVCSSETFRLT